MNIRQLSVVLPGACTGLLSVGMALAAEPPRSAVLEEIIVTAQKRDENLQEIPIAVTALTAEKRELIGITTIEDMTNFVPGLYYDTLLDRANIRGIGRVTNAAGSDPGVALYVDGFYSSSTTSAGRSTIFNDRVEVLRGPQGTLYGRNATGGAINTISRSPADQFGSEVRASYGDYDRKILEGTLTGPITDWLRFRVTAGMIKQDEGYFRNIGPGPDEGSVQDDRDYDAILEADLGESMDLTLRYSRREQFSLNRLNAQFTPYRTHLTCTPIPPATTCTASLNTSFIPLGLATLTTSPTTSFALRTASVPNPLFNTGTGLIPASPQYTVQNPATPSNRREFNTNTPSERVLDGSDTFIASLTWHLPAIDIKWIGGHNSYKFYSLTDTDSAGRESYVYTPPATLGGAANPGNAFPVTIYTEPHWRFFEDKSYWSNELNFASTGDGPLQWLAGLYQYREDYYQVPIAGETRQSPLQSELQAVYARPTALPMGPGATAIYDSWGAAQLLEPNPNSASAAAATNVIVHSYAAFSQLDWQFADAWRATLGLRYSIDRKEGWETRRTIIWDPTFAGSRAKAFDNSPPLRCYTAAGENDPANPNLQAVRDEATGSLTAIGSCRYRAMDQVEWKDYSGTTGVEWTPAEGKLIYAKYSRGYKSGAIRLGGFDADAAVDPEFIDAFEIGAKADITPRLQVNASAYYYDYKGYQFPLSFRDPGSNVLRTEYTNLDAENYGLELESIWVPVDAMTVLLNYAYEGSEVTSDVYLVDPLDPLAQGPDASSDVQVVSPTQIAQNARGNRLPGQPEHKVSANVSYGWQFVPGTLTASTTVSWRDRVSNSTGLLARDTTSTPDYYTTDARLTWAAADGRYSVIGYVANVLDEETYNTATSSQVNGEIVQTYNLNPPRTWGVEFQFRFGSEVR